MLAFPYKLVPDDNETLLVEFRDVPEAHTFGDDADEAAARATDALEAALSGYMDLRRDLPAPSKLRRGERLAVLPPLTEAKLRLYMEMRAAKIGKAELARRLNCHLPQVDRLLDLDHASRLDQIEAAFRCLGRRIDIQVVNAA
jgi:antitoxin HicB